MLQVNVKHFASDALEDAMRLAQTKALNSYTFSDCIDFLNYAWSDMYSRIAAIDDGYYGVNMRLTEETTHLPKYVKNSIQVYYAQSPVGHSRVIYRSAGTGDLRSSGVYRISGNDLYCPDVHRKTMWLYYVPACPQLFFTHHNRDPKLYDTYETVRNNVYNLFELYGMYEGEEVDITTATREDIMKCTSWHMRHRSTLESEDITEMLVTTMQDNNDGEWRISYISCDYPYIFITYEHSITGEHVSGIMGKDMTFNVYNPFEFTGRNSNVEYMDCHWNDKTGMGVVVTDYSDMYKVIGDDGRADIKYRIKELGWTPDTQLDYPAPEMYRYLVARLADKFAALNESDVMGVQKELIEARFAFEAFLDKDKSSWKRIENVNLPTIGDWL